MRCRAVAPSRLLAMGIPGSSTPKRRPRPRHESCLAHGIVFFQRREKYWLRTTGRIFAGDEWRRFCFRSGGSLRAGDVVGRWYIVYRCFIIARLRVVVNEVGAISRRWRSVCARLELLPATETTGILTPADSRRILSRVACRSCNRGEAGASILGLSRRLATD